MSLDSWYNGLVMCYFLRRADSVSGQSFGRLVYDDFSNVGHETVEFRCVSIVVDRAHTIVRCSAPWHCISLV